MPEPKFIPVPLRTTRVLHGIELDDFYFSFDLDSHRQAITVRMIRPGELAASIYRHDVYEAIRAELGEQIIMGRVMRSTVTHIEVDLDENRGDDLGQLELAIQALTLLRGGESHKSSLRPIYTKLITAAERHRAKLRKARRLPVS